MRKTKEIRAVCTVAERVALDWIAEMYGVKPTELMRELIRKEAGRYGIWEGIVERVQTDG